MFGHDTSETIGDDIAIRAAEGDEVTVRTTEEDALNLTVIDAPDGVPVEMSQTSEVICETADGEVIALYAQVTEMGEMRADYDVYAVRIPEDGDSESLGEIVELELDS